MPPTGGKPFQSKLIRYADQIRSWRRQGKSYLQISRLLAEQGVIVSPSTIFAFVKVRSKRRRLITMLDGPSTSSVIETPKRKSLPFHFDETKPLTLKPQ